MSAGPDMPAPPATIALARPQDIPPLAAVELAAARLLEGHAPPHILEGTIDPRRLHAARAAGRLWVALAREEDAPVGFALVEMLADDWPHLEEIDVHPRHGRRGLGTALVRAVCGWAAREGYPQITLTTFRAVPWNMPFYRRLGFEVVPAEGLQAPIAAVVQAETDRGLDPGSRVVMRYRTGQGG